MAEGADAARMTRSVPLGKALDDTLVALGQNGEALRPEQGYPLRLFVPGWEGNISVKWLRRIRLTDQPYMTREETSKYTDLLPDGRARQFTFMMEAKSVITHPAGGQRLADRGYQQIRGSPGRAAGASSGWTSPPTEVARGARPCCRNRCCRSRTRVSGSTGRGAGTRRSPITLRRRDRLRATDA